MKEATPESYDHSRKIGNEGDVVKHAVLARLTEEIISETKHQPFVYAESHTGKRSYRLPENREWLNGIGPLSEKLEKLNINESIQTKYRNLHSYFKTCFQSPIRVGSIYPGSSGIVRLVCQEQGIDPIFHLCEIKTVVCDDLRDSYQEDSGIVIYCEDGYKVLGRIDPPTLALVDPIFVEKEEDQIMSVLEDLSNKDADFLCWTALCGTDIAFLNKFKANIDKKWTTCWVRWKEIYDHTWGCQITVPNNRKEIVGKTIDEIKEIMRWF